MTLPFEIQIITRCDRQRRQLWSLVFGDSFLAQGLHLKSHQRCSAGIRAWLSADQSSSSTLTDHHLSLILALYTDELSC